MIGVVYLGSNQQTKERLKYLPGCQVKLTSNYMEAKAACASRVRGEHLILLYERGVRTEDVTAITYLRKNCKGIYIILLTDELSDGDRAIYQHCGINDTLEADAPVSEISKKLKFISERESVLFGKEVKRRSIPRFKIPLWKRAFDVVFALSAIIVLSPLMIVTVLAIKIESKGPVLFRSKRVGTNYKIFDFLKFRSMYADAEKRLMELSKTSNLYAGGESVTVITSPLGEEAEQEMKDKGMESEMMISDDEVMLVGDDYVVAESDFNRQKDQNNSNAFVKIENDPRVTKVGRFIRKYSIDELPQLFNILKGDMSVVGNRPLPVYEAEKLTADNSIDRFMAPAGLTGLWQVEERSKGGYMSAEERKQLDIRYGQTYSFALDIKIIFRTFCAFVEKENV